IIAADVLVMPSLAYVAGQYSFQLFGLSGAAGSKWAIFAVGVGWIAVMTLICYIGVELSARTQQVLLSIEIFTLTLFAVVALIKVYANHPAHSIEPAFSWFNPFDIGSTHALIGGVLLGIFIYWGWDSGVAVNEESDDPGGGGLRRSEAADRQPRRRVRAAGQERARLGPRQAADHRRADLGERLDP